MLGNPGVLPRKPVLRQGGQSFALGRPKLRRSENATLGVPKSCIRYNLSKLPFRKLHLAISHHLVCVGCGLRPPRWIPLALRGRVDRPRTYACPCGQRTANTGGDARAVTKCLGKGRDTQHKQEACGFPGPPHHQWGDPVDNVAMII